MVAGLRPASADSPASVASVHVNRTVPHVEPVKTTLEFSAKPTTQEIFRAHVFEEPLIPVGGEPTPADNSILATALLGYAQRNGPDDFASLTAFLEAHPGSPWTAALQTDLGLEYYNTAHYSLALESWRQAWSHAKDVRDPNGKALLDRAAGELAYMYARLGRMTELDTLLTSVSNRIFVGPATERIAGAREGLWTMKNHPEVAFRCGPLALLRIKLAVDPQHPATDIIRASASTQRGFSLPQVAELSSKIGLNYQMAFREKDGAFVVPSVLHWKVGHYAALIRQVGDRYLVQDPTFRNDVWATREALESETSGYFLIPAGTLPAGWRTVDASEGGSVWGRGTTSANDPGPITRNDLKKGPAPCMGMIYSGVHLMDVNLNLVDVPLGYKPPVGPPVYFTIRYNARDAFQPANFQYGNFGSKWTSDWISYITDSPQSPLADVTYYVGGGGRRTFTGFDTNTQSFNFQEFDETLLTRTGTNSYQLEWPDGSLMIFAQPDGSVGSTRNVFLTQIIDPQGNAVALTYDSDLRLTAITDAIGQVTTLTYDQLPALPGQLDPDNYKITKVTDPFGRVATFNYTPALDFIIFDGCPDNCYTSSGFTWVLGSVTDAIGMTSQVNYIAVEVGEYITNNFTEFFESDLVSSLITPYGTNFFSQGDNGTTRFLETIYPDGSRDRVEFNQTFNGIPDSDPLSSVPQGMATSDSALSSRDTYYWSRNACAMAYGDFSKARVYHWLHNPDISTCSGILESTKEALEGRVWRDYAGQAAPFSTGSNNRPAHIGRVLDDGSTQLYTYAYNGFGHVTNQIDPAGRTFNYHYATNGIDLLEVRQTRAGNNELLFKATYNSHHLPLTIVDAAGQTNIYTYNTRGQTLSITDPKHASVIYSYDTNGYVLRVNGPLPGTNDMITATYDFFGRTRTVTDVSGYTLTFDYDNLNRITRVTHPDSTFEQLTYDRMDLAGIQDRAGRQTLFEHNSIQQMTKSTDPLGRVTLFNWCTCGGLKSLTDPMGRKTVWLSDVQARPVSKQYSDGSQVNYLYENTTSRVLQMIDEKQQGTRYTYNTDDTLKSIDYFNAAVPTPDVAYTYDPDYWRVTSVTDGTGTNLYSYIPITGTPTLGAGQLASADGPLPNDTITYSYDELGRLAHRVVNGMDSSLIYDAAGRVSGATNALGAFAYAYDGSSGRLVSQSFPNGQAEAATYGGSLQDFTLQQISYSAAPTPISQFIYGNDVSKGQITTWSQQTGAQTPSIFNFGYDAANQLLSVAVTNAGALVNTFDYGYDPAGNRLSEQVGAAINTTTYNTLNQINATTTPGSSRTNEWDVANRLVAVNAGNQRTEFTYDGQSRMVGIRQSLNGTEVSHRLFLWNGGAICEELDANGGVTKRFFPQGVQFTTGTNAGMFYYTRDHLGSIRELTDANGNVRARYTYDPFGRRTKVSGDVDADFGFAGMFWSPEASLALTHFRAYDPGLGRWLSRDPLQNAEMHEGPNVYAYVRNDPVSLTDSTGLCLDSVCAACRSNPQGCALLATELGGGGAKIINELQEAGQDLPAAVEEVGQCVSTAVGYAPGWSQNIATANTMLPSTVQSLAPVAQQALPNADLLLKAPDYEFVALSYELPEVAWADENGLEIFGEEAEILTENLGWANLYRDAAFDNLAQSGLSPGAEMRGAIDQILATTALIRGSLLP